MNRMNERRSDRLDYMVGSALICRQMSQSCNNCHYLCVSRVCV